MASVTVRKEVSGALPALQGLCKMLQDVFASRKAAQSQ